MRQFFLILFTGLLCIQALSQEDVTARPVVDTVIRLRCGLRLPDSYKPLYFVDGLLVNDSVFRALKPDDITSVEVLKSDAINAVYGSRGANGAIVVDTKKNKRWSFRLKDPENDQPLAGATVILVRESNSRDSLLFVSDIFGRVETADLHHGGQYRLIVSYVGYRSVDHIIPVSGDQLIHSYKLSRDVKENADVTVIGYGGRRCRCGCGIRTIVSYTHTAAAVEHTSPMRVFPNPAVRGADVTVDLVQPDGSPVQVRVLNLNGATLRNTAYQPVKGSNRIRIPIAMQWSAGIYFIQVVGHSGKLLKQEKIIIQ
jgi:TonB-dependent SusC/RagA subfamily outer membrane receptor